MSYKKLSPVKTIASVARYHLKNKPVDQAFNNRSILMPRHSTAAGTTEKLIEERLNIRIKKLLNDLPSNPPANKFISCSKQS